MYYKDDTHYFVMTAKKQCLLRLGVLRQVGLGPRREERGRRRLGWTVHPWLWTDRILSCLQLDCNSI